MADEKRAIGAVDSGSIRRIGFSHAVVTPARSSRLIDINSERVALERTVKALSVGRRQIAELEAARAGIEQRIAEFEAAPIDRIDSDPLVPLISPAELSKLEAEQDAKALAAELAEQAAKAAAPAAPVPGERG